MSWRPVRKRSTSPRVRTRTSATARFMPLAPVGGTMWAASPARKRRPWRIGSQTKERIWTMLFWKILPSVSVQPSPVSRGAGADEGEPALVEAVDQLLRGRRPLDEDAEPSERVGPRVLLAGSPGEEAPGGAEEAVGPHDEVAGELLLLLGVVAEAHLPGLRVETGAPAEKDAGPVGVEVAQACGRRLEHDAPARLQAGGVEVLYDLLLAVDDDALSREVRQGDPVPPPAEAELDPLVDGPLAVHPLPHARLAQQCRGGVLEHPGPDRGLDLLAAAKLQHHGLYAPQVQQVREQRTRRPAPNDAYLCAHLPPVSHSTCAAVATFLGPCSVTHARTSGRFTASWSSPRPPRQPCPSGRAAASSGCRSSRSRRATARAP